MGCKGGKCSLKGKSKAGPSKPSATYSKNKYGTVSNIPTMTPQQSGLLATLSKLGLKGQEDLYPRMMGDPMAGFAPIQQQAQQNFNQRTVPTIAQRFSSMGDGKLNPNSQFERLIKAGGGNLSTDLAALGSDYGMNQRNQQMNYLNSLLGQGLQPQVEAQYHQRPPSAWGSIGGGLMNAGMNLMGA